MVLRRVRPDDEPTLLTIFSDPEVAKWWDDPHKSVEETMEDDESETHYIIEVDGEAIGMIQSVEENEPMYRSAGIDIAIRGPSQGKGYGPDAIRTLAHDLVRRGHHRLTIDPAAHNTNAIKAYESVGFKTVGVMRKYERGPDGKWHDGLLMDMLAEELRD